MDFRARKGFKRKATLQAAHIMATNYTKSINSVFRQFLRIYARHVGKDLVRACDYVFGHTKKM